MKMPSSDESAWDEYYRSKGLVIRFIEFMNRSYFSKVFERQFKSVVGNVKNLRILEAACGSGIMSARLSKEGADTALLDLSENAIRVARRNFRSRDHKFLGVRADIFRMPFKENSFDVVWNQGVLEHFDNPSDVVNEMLRVTKSGGNMVIFVPAHLSPLHFVYVFLEKLGQKDKWPFAEQIFFKKSKLKDIITNAGLRDVIVKRIPGSFYFSIMGASKK